jgi:hypothetical protein
LGVQYWACKEVMRQNFIQDLLAKGVTENKKGVNVYDLTYDELRHEVAMLEFKDINTDNDQNKWF